MLSKSVFILILPPGRTGTHCIISYSIRQREW